MEKILTVSIAAYNVYNYLNETLNPFLGVKGNDRLEVLIIDDGATDGTLELALEYQEKYPNVFRVIHKENGGWGSTVTTGILNATGKYFKLLDGDDYYNKDELERLLDQLETCDYDMVITPFLRFYDNSDRIDYVKNPLFEVSTPRQIELNELPIKPYCMEMYSLAFKTNLIQQNQVQITEHCFYTDNEYVVKCSSLCKTAIVMPYCIYCYRLARPGQSVSVDGMRKHYKEFELILRKMLTYVKQNVTNKHLQELFYERYRGLSYYYYETLFLMGAGKEYKMAMKSYDQWLKKEFPDIYKKISYRYIKIMRVTNYYGFGLIAKHCVEKK